MICDVRKPWLGQVFAWYLNNIVSLLQNKAFEQKNRKNYNLRLIWFLCRVDLLILQCLCQSWLGCHGTARPTGWYCHFHCFLFSQICHVFFMQGYRHSKQSFVDAIFISTSKREQYKTKHCFELTSFVALHWFLLTSYLHTKPWVNAYGLKAFLDGI